MNQAKNVRPYAFLFVVAAAILWSLDSILRSQLRASLPPINIVFWEHAIAVLLLLPVAWVKRAEIFHLSKQDHLIFALLGFLASVLATLCYTAALGQVGFIPFSIVVLLQKLQPIWAIGSAKILLKEKVPKNFLWWAVLALLASYLVSFKDLSIQWNLGDKTLFAAILAILASFFWGTATSFGRFQLHKTSLWTTLFLRFSYGLLGSLLFLFLLSWFAAPLSQILAFPLGGSTINFALSDLQIQNLLLVVLVTGLGAMILYYRGLQHTSAKVATICEMVWPASALIIDLFYDLSTGKFGWRPELFSWSQGIGIALLLIAVYVIGKKHPEEYHH